jgi:hypothetical protein
MLMLAPMISGAMLYSALKLSSIPHPQLLPHTWRIEPPFTAAAGSTLGALVEARRQLVDLATLCATILLTHVLASHAHEWRYRRKMKGAGEGERTSVPRSERKKLRLYVYFALTVTAGAIGMKLGMLQLEWGIWQSKLDCIYPSRSRTC